MTTHPDRIYPPLLVQGQTWEQMTSHPAAGGYTGRLVPGA